MRHTYYLQLIVLTVVQSFIACGSGGNFENYQPKNLEVMANWVALEYGTEMEHLTSMSFNSGIPEDVADRCSFPVGGYGCVSVKSAEIFIEEDYKDNCKVLVHEMIHHALYITTGDSDHDHKDANFNRTTKICSSLGLPSTL